MNREEVREVVKDTVRETLTALGLDAQDPIEVQRDLSWVRQTRLASAAMRAKAGAAVLGLLLTAAATAGWLGLKALLRSDAP